MGKWQNVFIEVEHQHQLTKRWERLILIPDSVKAWQKIPTVTSRRFLSSVVGVRGGLVDDHSERTDGTIPSDQRSHSRRVQYGVPSIVFEETRSEGESRPDHLTPPPAVFIRSYHHHQDGWREEWKGKCPKIPKKMRTILKNVIKHTKENRTREHQKNCECCHLFFRLQFHMS